MKQSKRTNFVVTDPKGELLRDCGNYLAEAGYDIYVLDLIHMSKSHCYNPSAFLETENDVQQAKQISAEKPAHTPHRVRHLPQKRGL